MLFNEEVEGPKMGLAMICDLEGFSGLLAQADVQSYVARFLNRIFKYVNINIYGGTPYWLDDKSRLPALLKPVHVKFLGDGLLHLWVPPHGCRDFDQDFVTELMNRMWNFKTFFEASIRRCSDDVPLLELPKRIRFGFAKGSVFELTRRDNGHRE